ncbi:hypothetical protein DRQ50_10125, partial [bacterium]
MRRSFTALLLLALLATAALAADKPLLRRDGGGVLYGGPAAGSAKAVTDSFLLMGPTGSGAPFIGDFELQHKALDPALSNGWTSRDWTAPTGSYWQVSDYFAVNGSSSAWCGDLSYASCDGGVTDPAGGYGPNWDNLLEWRQQVADPNLATTLGITATANIHSEPGYDGTKLQVEKFDLGLVDLNYWDGVQPGLYINETATYQPGEYMGAGADEVVVIWHFRSDGAYDDEDCSYPTSGGIQLDDVTI